MAVVLKLKFSYAFLFIAVLSLPVRATYFGNTYLSAKSIEMIKNDMPTYKDLIVYLPLLSRVVSFCEQHQKGVTMNLAHGLFLINVNLVSFVNDEEIPQAFRLTLEQLLARSHKLQTDYNASSSGNRKMTKILSALTTNATSWSNRLRKLNFDLLQKTFSHGQYPEWNTYLAAIENIERGVPSPRQSDICVGSLLQTDENLSNDSDWRCELPNECYKAIINGTDFGYWLSHREILLLHARLSRNCAIFSEHEDHLYRIEFCERAYREVEYIALNGFQIVDLLLEHIAICALDGNAQFLRRSWLISILQYQQPSGCFQLYKLAPADTPALKDCNDHAMAVALAAYAAAIRLILEDLKTMPE